MNLLDAIFLIGQMPEGSCICAKRPFHQTSEAAIVPLTEDFRVPQGTLDQGLEYFLEKDGVEELLQMAESRLHSREAKVELVAYYAEYDATPAWFNDLCR